VRIEHLSTKVCNLNFDDFAKLPTVSIGFKFSGCGMLRFMRGLALAGIKDSTWWFMAASSSAPAGIAFIETII
jgi:hypothetical protein